MTFQEKLDALPEIEKAEHRYDFGDEIAYQHALEARLALARELLAAMIEEEDADGLSGGPYPDARAFLAKLDREL